MEKINYILPKDIILEILTRLPLESVSECKLVCKPWRDLIRHPSFSQLHSVNHIDSGKLSFVFLCREQEYCHGQQPLNGFYYSEYNENRHYEQRFHRKIKINLSPSFVDLSFIGSCNGLLCFNGWVRDESGNLRNHGPAYICNPITREYVILPRFKGQYLWTGFGYTSSTNEYKIVRVSEVGNVQLYTLGSGNGWRDAGTTDIHMKCDRYCVGELANEALHWADKEGTIIFVFCLSDEKFREHISPPCFKLAGVSRFSMSLGVLGDFLSATYFHDAGGFEIWLLKKKNKDNCNAFSWSKKYSLNHFDDYASWPLGYTKSGRLLCYGHNHIYDYDPNDSSSKTDVYFSSNPSQEYFNLIKSIRREGYKNNGIR